MTKYHLITYCSDFGYDDKDDLSTMADVKKMANFYLDFSKHIPDALEDYEKVFVFSSHRLVKVYEKGFRNGRNPYKHEKEDFTNID